MPFQSVSPVILPRDHSIAAASFAHGGDASPEHPSVQSQRVADARNGRGCEQCFRIPVQRSVGATLPDDGPNGQHFDADGPVRW
jgi:hypothetical protein